MKTNTFRISKTRKIVVLGVGRGAATKFVFIEWSLGNTYDELAAKHTTKPFGSYVRPGSFSLPLTHTH